MDFRRSSLVQPALNIFDRTVMTVKFIKVLGTTITRDLKWQQYQLHSPTSSVEYVLLHQLRKFNQPKEVMVQFYTAIAESIITTSITVWDSSTSKQNIHRLQPIISSVEKTIGVKLTALLDLYSSRTRRCAEKILSSTRHTLDTICSVNFPQVGTLANRRSGQQATEECFDTCMTLLNS